MKAIEEREQVEEEAEAEARIPRCTTIADTHAFDVNYHFV